MGELELHRPKEYDTRKQASDPITGGSAAVLTTIAVRFGSFVLTLIGETDRPPPSPFVSNRRQDYTRGIGQIFINPPKGIINTTTAIPKGTSPLALVL